MKVYLYAKNTEDVNEFQDIIELLRRKSENIYLSIESRRAFYELDKVKNITRKDDIIVIGSLNSLGLNNTDISHQLEWFILKPRILVVMNMPSTYEFGLSQPLNRAVLSALQQTIMNNQNITAMKQNNRSNSGRNKINFPDNWEVLYEKWERGEITSKVFYESSGLKKATFYNMLTEYKSIQEINKKYVEKYKCV